MKKPIEQRSSMEVTIGSRLLGVTVTIFILILTIKSELLSYTIMTAQLVLAIPFIIGGMILNSKILTSQTLKRYVVMNRMFSSAASAFIFNTIGLLISKYASFVLGIIYFITFITVLLALVFIDIDKSEFKNKLIHEILMIVLMISLGLLPALGYYGL